MRRLVSESDRRLFPLSSYILLLYGFSILANKEMPAFFLS